MPSGGLASVTGRRNLLQNDRTRRVAQAIGPAVLIVVAQALFFRENPWALRGVYLYGFVLGVLSALVALGMAMVYRANRILNFAQGNLGLAPTVLALHLIAFSGLPYFVAFGLGLAVAVVLGGLIEFLVIRRFARSPRLILTVATIGLSQLLAVSSMAIPLLWGKDPLSLPSVAPFDLRLEVAPMTFDAGALMAVVLAPIALFAVIAFLRFTTAGVAVRAAAERADRASLLGVPVRRLNTLVWMIAAALSFFGVFLRGAMNGIPVGGDGYATTTFITLLAALAALTLGRFTNLVAIATSAVALGILEQQVVYHNGRNPAVVYPVLGLVIMIGLGVRRAARSRVDHDDAASWQAADEIRPIPRELRRLPEVVSAKWGGLAVLGVAAFLLPELPFLGDSDLIKISAVAVYAIIGISIIVLTGWAGQVSLGQMGFVGTGAAVGALVTKEWGLDLSIAVVVAGIVGALVAVVVGLPALRLRGLMLGVTTLAFATTAAYYLLNPVSFPWIPISRIERPPLFGRFDLDAHASMYRLCLVTLVLVILAVTGLRRSRTGRVLQALRENERGAQAYGINVVRAKLTGFALSGFLAAVAGCLLVHITRSFSIASFKAEESFNVFTSTVIGGLGGQTGAVLGAIFSRGGTWFLEGNWQLLPSAVGVLLVLLVFPGGFAGLLFRGRDRWLRSVARRSGIVVPSLLADVSAEERNVLSGAEAHVEALDSSDDATGRSATTPASSDDGAHLPGSTLLPGGPPDDVAPPHPPYIGAGGGT